MEDQKVENNEPGKTKLLEENAENPPLIKAYKRRWIILTIYIIYSAINGFQWIEYSSITNVAVKYYRVSSLAVDWTSIIYMALYPILAVPATFVIHRKGLRMAGLIGCIGTLIGTSIKVFSIGSDLFYVVLLGQAVVAAAQILIICLPPKIAAIWFQANEVSTACSLGVFGTLVGTAVGYLLPPIIVKDSDNLEDIGIGLKLMCWILAASTIPVTAAVIFYFPNQPPLPPSLAQAMLRQNEPTFKTDTFFLTIKQLILNKGFMIHTIAYGINGSVNSAVGILLTQFILQNFEGANEAAGWMGFVFIFVGIIGSVAGGILLDKTHKYKELAIFTYFCSGISVIVFMVTLLWKLKLLTYISCGLFGFFSSGYMLVGFEIAMELTFPAEETITVGLLIAVLNTLSIIFTIAMGHINMLIGSFWSLGSQAALLFLGTIITGFVPNRKLRQEAFRVSNK